MTLHRFRALGCVVLLASSCSLLEPKPEPVVHTVVRGDTLSKLARKHHTTVAELKAWNALESDLIEVGQPLVVAYIGGTAPTPTADASASSAPQKQRRRIPTTPPGPAAAHSVGALSMPPEQSCLAGPELVDGGDDPAFAGSAGLSRAQVRSAMNAFLPTLQRCITGDWPSGTLDLSITVACTGRVSTVRVQNDGGLDASLVTCIQDTLRYAPFPAHDLPDGETFGYPMVFSQ
ncbi:MAG: hypothetical protein CL927_04555 [Deltaproteobacteria bacterium]|nr:hypothetical protein [Deltaproteobacteria bacterium]HCH65329.1 hypothetical protein [Deltaproteobacteria bacterium]